MTLFTLLKSFGSSYSTLSLCIMMLFQCQAASGLNQKQTWRFHRSPKTPGSILNIRDSTGFGCWEVLALLSVGRDANFAKLKNDDMLPESRICIIFNISNFGKKFVLTRNLDQKSTCRCCEKSIFLQLRVLWHNKIYKYKPDWSLEVCGLFNSLHCAVPKVNFHSHFSFSVLSCMHQSLLLLLMNWLSLHIHGTQCSIIWMELA